MVGEPCQVPGCRNDSEMGYLGLRVCQMCFATGKVADVIGETADGTKPALPPPPAPKKRKRSKPQKDMFE